MKINYDTPYPKDRQFLCFIKSTPHVFFKKYDADGKFIKSFFATFYIFAYSKRKGICFFHYSMPKLIGKIIDISDFQRT